MKRLSAICLTLLMLVSACGHSPAPAPDTSDSPETFDPWKAESLAYRYLGSVVSPYRNEGRYIAFLDSFLAIDSLPEALRERAGYRRRIAMLNRPGSIAADFSYLERDGSESRLHQLGSPWTLLVFYDPECQHCTEILHALAASPAINTAIAEQKLTVLAIYAEGKRNVWNASRHDMPENWLVGYDLTGILDEEIYNLPAMPTPYLLDSDKRVILKDPDIRYLIRRISLLTSVRRND